MQRFCFGQLRSFSTKGHKKTRKNRARLLFIKKNTPPKPLPWHLHTKPHPDLIRLIGNEKELYSMMEVADLMIDVMYSTPDRSPLQEVLDRVYGNILEAQKSSYKKKEFPLVAEQVLRELQLPVPNPKFLSGTRAEVNQVLVDILSTPNPELQLSSLDLQQLVQASEENAVQLGLRAEHLQTKITEKLDINFWQHQQAIKTESSSALQAQFDLLQETDLLPNISVGTRLIYAHLREENPSQAWEIFNRFNTKGRAHVNISLYKAGMDTLIKTKKVTRAMTLFEEAEDYFPAQDMPFLYHSTMRACKTVRQSCYFSFELYHRMTKVNMLTPTVETLTIVLETCSVLGDVIRAKQLWHEMVEEYKVVPDANACSAMLYVLARGNRMLRARALKASSVKVLTMQDKALLATCGGFLNAPIKFTDEVQDVIRELESGEAPDPANYQSDYERYLTRKKQAELAARQEEEEEEEEGLENGMEEEDFDGDEFEEGEEEEEEKFAVKTLKGSPSQLSAAKKNSTTTNGITVDQASVSLFEDSTPATSLTLDEKTAVPSRVNRKRQAFFLPGEKEEDYLGEVDEEEEAEKSRLAPTEEKKEGEEEDLFTLKESELVGNEHVIHIPGLSPDKIQVFADKRDTYATIIAQRSPFYALEEDAIKGTTPGQRQEANMLYATRFFNSLPDTFHIKVDTHLLNSYVKVFAYALRLNRAVAMLDLFDEYKLEKDLTTYNTIINMYCRSQRLGPAFEYFNMVKKNPQLEINRMTVGPLIDALARNRRMTEAFDMYLEYKHLNLLEKHIRFIRNKFRMSRDPRYNEFPDPNFWRSRENIAAQRHALSRSKSGLAKQKWIESMILG